tara:strand:- start:1074 stop:1907 length:834 start_codon:yes stop_codon:yes gene_type:complete
MNWCCLNGELMPLHKARISPMDRGFLFGDGVYEVMAQIDGQIRAKSLHAQRLQLSLDSIGLDTSIEHVFADVDRLIKKAGFSNAKIYIQVTRGTSSVRNHSFPSIVSPTIFLTVSDFEAVSQMTSKAIVRPDIRWRKNYIKSTALLGNVLLMQEARDSDAQEAILYREEYVTEASTSNVFVIRGQKVVTPPLSDLILPGITRHIVIEIAHNLGISIVEDNIRVDCLQEVDGIFLTSSTRGLMPIVELNPGGSVGNGKLTSIFLALQDAYDEKLRCYD